MDRRFKGVDLVSIHKMEKPDIKDINNNFKDSFSNISAIDNIITSSSKEYKKLLENCKVKIASAKEMLKAERERLQDINILCNKYSNFGSIINISTTEVSGDLSFKDGVISSKITNTSPVSYSIEGIEGNGTAGNSYVLIEDEFAINKLDTSNKNFINDGEITTAFEYQRITASNSEGSLPSLFNQDSIETECSISIKADSLVNEIIINTDREDLILNKVYISNDGLSYELSEEQNVSLNNSNEMYNKQDYIFKGGIVQVKPSRYIKLLFSSKGYSNDTLAYEKAFASNDEEKITILEKVKTARRHLIRINDIELKKNEYEKGYLLSRELITTPIECISIFSNEYISNARIEDNIKYYLIINGIDYEVVPVNSHRNGKKIVRTSAQLYEIDSVQYIKESIKSAKLKVVVTNMNRDITPYISNLKILVGENNV